MGSSLRRKGRTRKRLALFSPLFSDDLRMPFEYMLAFVSSPKTSEQIDHEKQAAAQAALRYVRNGMLLGLGSGSTASCFLSLLAERVRREGLRVNAVASSLETAARAQKLGIPVLEPQRGVRVDLTIDGADEIAPDLSLIKGAGGALLREKIVACASRHFLVIADSSKVVPQLGRRPVPLEVTPFARPWVMDRITELGGAPVWRMEKSKPDRPCLTDQQNHIVDCDFGLIVGAQTLAARLDGISGVVEHGLFLGLVRAALIAEGEQIIVLRPGRPPMPLGQSDLTLD
jgi:ribose 5-phosphate isomerase A